MGLPFYQLSWSTARYPHRLTNSGIPLNLLKRFTACQPSMFSRHKKPLTPKQKKIFFKVLIGLKKWSYIAKQNNTHIRFLTLTSSVMATHGLNESERIDMLHRNFQSLRMRLKRDHNLEIREYFKVTTTEGNGVIHLLYEGDWISEGTIIKEWNELHGSQIIYIEEQQLDTEGLLNQACYLVTQYLSNQQNCVTRYGMTKNWVYPAFLKDWKMILVNNRQYTGGFNVYGYQEYKIDIEKSKYQFNVILTQKFGLPYPLKPPTLKPPSKKHRHRKRLLLSQKKPYRDLLQYQQRKTREVIQSLEPNNKQSTETITSTIIMSST